MVATKDEKMADAKVVKKAVKKVALLVASKVASKGLMDSKKVVKMVASRVERMEEHNDRPRE